jgi:polyvinyl alcohol dehydrogenase (cytochrome)
MFYALDPDTGKTNWQVRVGAGGELGGIEYGFANDGRRAYVPVSDVNADGRANGSLTAIDLATGKIAWRVAGATDTCTGKAQPPCNNAYLGPPSVAGEVVYAGSNDGVLRAFDRADGTVLWSFDTVRDYAGANGVQGTGGSLGFGGPVIAGSRLYIMSGHSFLNTGLPGNVLLAFDIP